MKDVYELLNDVDVDLSQYEEVELNDMEKKRIKKRLHQNLKAVIIPKVSKVIAAVLCVLVVAGFTLAKTAPTFAEGIPVVGKIIKHITGYDYAEFDKYTSVINKDVVKSEVTATLNEVMLDENQLRIASTFKSDDKFKGNSVLVRFPEIYINGKHLNVGGGSTGQFLDSNTYLNVDTLDIHNVKVPDNISMKVVYNEVQFLDEKGNENKKITGPWAFEFNVSKSEIEKNTKVIKLNNSVATSDIKMNLKELRITPLTTNLTYKLKGDKSANFIIKDDKGNELIEEGSGYGTDGLIGGVKGEYEGYSSFSAVSKEAKKLYIIPYYNYLDKKNGESKFTKTEPVKWNNEAITLKQDDKNKIIISKIQRKDGKIYVDYKTEGVSVKLQARRLYLYNSSKEQMVRSHGNDNMKDIVNSNDTLHAVFKDDGSSDIYVGTDNMGEISILKDNEFTVDLN
ncbi:DUF4179 domain-containing protein [Clostridium omnivorum]|uniref:DUF4179 domain-containing protein n=1 Tax=Clostridium omnivorum TaxID=1604902 RepID=A0ABQ5N4R8_9CLOT|nr:DUF4179 domain-containing protein [Clostridium sp. E14]GLC30199.1 hypothetical protein bsdE14_16090 [Clostridium sp. E14]